MRSSLDGADETLAMSMIQRDLKLRADAKAAAVRIQIRRNVAPKSEMLTDENPVFVGLARYYLRCAVYFFAGEYVRLGGWVHANSIETAWALLTRQILGIRYWVSDKNFKLYIAEMTWRFSRLAWDLTDRLNALLACVKGPMSHKVLIG